MGNESEEHLDRLSALWLGYATKVYGSYSPVNAALARAVAHDPEVMRLVQASPPHVHDPNMLLAAIQYVVLGGTDDPIATLYAGDVSDGSVGPIVHQFCAREWPMLSELMAARYIQTNEVGRAPTLALGIASAARPSLVRQADMVADLPGVLDEMAPHPTVVVTSWAYSYLPMEVREPFVEALAAAGRDRPVAWVCADGVWVSDLFTPPTGPAPDDLAPSLLGLAVFGRAGRDLRALAYIQPHGVWIDWLDPGVVPALKGDVIA